MYSEHLTMNNPTHKTLKIPFIRESILFPTKLLEQLIIELHTKMIFYSMYFLDIELATLYLPVRHCTADLYPQCMKNEMKLYS